MNDTEPVAAVDWDDAERAKYDAATALRVTDYGWQTLTGGPLTSAQEIRSRALTEAVKLYIDRQQPLWELVRDLHAWLTDGTIPNG